VELCARLGEGVEGGGPSPNAWVRVGSAFRIPDAGMLNDFDAAGFAGADRWALFSTVVMRGYVARRTAGGNPIEYRFRTSATTADNGSPAVAAGSFGRVVDGDGINPLFASVRLGDLVRLSPLKIVEVWAHASDLRQDNSADPQTGGWLNVDRVVRNAFAAEPDFAGLTLGTDVLWGRNDALMGVNTTALTTGADVPAGSVAAGQGVPAAQQIDVERFAFRFEIREVDAGTGVPVGPLPANGTTLNRAVVNNNAAVIKLALAASPACEPQTGTVRLAYTAYHPHLWSVSLHVRSNDSAYSHFQPDVPPPAGGTLPVTGNTNPALVQVFNPDFAVTPALTQKCAYLAKLTVHRRLHTGDGAIGSDSPAEVFFFWS
ncbi:MAG TPA: hypothetical protein VGV85_12865, partial [Longimicrobiaceae bacterium]|nr:hypothetical protein [Longimicrobiaceae bacterium]